MKRQRWLAKQRDGGRQVQGRPTLDISTPCEAPAPKSPLSRLVAEGYPQAQFHGDRRQTHGGRAPSGFSGSIAGQWSANVQHDVASRQNRHDPSIAGPSRPSGGQRVTQASGGNASIDLSWQAPRLPSGTYRGGSGASRAYSDPGLRQPSPMQPRPCPWGRDDAPGCPDAGRQRNPITPMACAGFDGPRGRGGMRPPGGASSVVFG